MSIALITSVYGAYDPVHPYDDSWGFDDAVIVTDDPDIDAPGWRVHLHTPRVSPRMASKHPKMNPWLYTDCDAALWVDASIEITSADIRRWVEPQLAQHDLIVWQHPEGRNDIREEGPVCWDWPKYEPYPIREQVEAYVADGMPERWGLFACGMIGWRFTEDAKRFGDLWLEEQYKWSIQDQISLPYLLWREGKRFGVWPANQYQNDLLRIRWDRRPAGQGPQALS